MMSISWLELDPKYVIFLRRLRLPFTLFFNGCGYFSSKLLILIHVARYVNLIKLLKSDTHARTKIEYISFMLAKNIKVFPVNLFFLRVKTFNKAIFRSNLSNSYFLKGGKISNTIDFLFDTG